MNDAMGKPNRAKPKHPEDAALSERHLDDRREVKDPIARLGYNLPHAIDHIKAVMPAVEELQKHLRKGLHKAKLG